MPAGPGCQTYCMDDAVGLVTSTKRERDAVYARIFYDSGWFRHLPSLAAKVLAAVSDAGTATAQDIGRFVDPENPARGLFAAAWTPLTPWTEESLAEVNGDQTPLPEDPQNADEANAEDQWDRDRKVAAVARYSEALGVAAPRTVDHVIDLMVACTLLGSAMRDGRATYRINPDPRQPVDVLPLTARQRAYEAHWKHSISQPPSR